MRESERLVFPWSTWAKMHIFLILSGIFCSSSTFSFHVRVPVAAACCYYDVDYIII